MTTLDNNPARANGPLNAAMNPWNRGYTMNSKSHGCEISAAATSDGGALALVRPSGDNSPWMWQARSLPGAAAWEPLTRGSFPMYASASSMVRTHSGAIIVGGRFPHNSLQVSFDDGRSWRFYSHETRCGGNGIMAEVAPDVVIYFCEPPTPAEIPNGLWLVLAVPTFVVASRRARRPNGWARHRGVPALSGAEASVAA